MPSQATGQEEAGGSQQGGVEERGDPEQGAKEEGSSNSPPPLTLAEAEARALCQAGGPFASEGFLCSGGVHRHGDCRVEGRGHSVRCP